MSKLTEQLREKRVSNPYDFYNGQPYITYHSHDRRSCTPSCWAVIKRGLTLSDAWHDYGARTFSGFGNRKGALAEAQAWAAERFGIKVWARDPFGSYGDADFIKQRIKELR